VRGTSPQGMLPAGSVATLEPMVTESVPPSGGRMWLRGNGPVMRWDYPAGIESYSRPTTNRTKEMFSGSLSAATAITLRCGPLAQPDAAHESAVTPAGRSVDDGCATRQGGTARPATPFPVSGRQSFSLIAFMPCAISQRPPIAARPATSPVPPGLAPRYAAAGSGETHSAPDERAPIIRRQVDSISGATWVPLRVWR
jgi:hypothetical protein